MPGHQSYRLIKDLLHVSRQVDWLEAGMWMCRELFGKIEYDRAAVCKEQLRSMQALRARISLFAGHKRFWLLISSRSEQHFDRKDGSCWNCGAQCGVGQAQHSPDAEKQAHCCQSESMDLSKFSLQALENKAARPIKLWGLEGSIPRVAQGKVLLMFTKALRHQGCSQLSNAFIASATASHQWAPVRAWFARGFASRRFPWLARLWKRAADSALGFVPVPHSTSSIAAVTQFNKMLRLFVPQERHMMESDDEELEFGVKWQSLTWAFLEFSCSTWAFRSQMQKKRTGTVCVFSNPCSSRHRVFVILMMQWFVSFSVSLTPLGVAQRFKQATWTVWIFV